MSEFTFGPNADAMLRYVMRLTEDQVTGLLAAIRLDQAVNRTIRLPSPETMVRRALRSSLKSRRKR